MILVDGELGDRHGHTRLPPLLSQHRLDGVEDRRHDGDAAVPVELATTVEDLGDDDDDDDDYWIRDRNLALATKLWPLSSGDLSNSRVAEKSAINLMKHPQLAHDRLQFLALELLYIFSGSSGSLGIGPLGHVVAGDEAAVVWRWLLVGYCCSSIALRFRLSFGRRDLDGDPSYNSRKSLSDRHPYVPSADDNDEESLPTKSVEPVAGVIARFSTRFSLVSGDLLPVVEGIARLPLGHLDFA
ncbi:hypothetical protein TIFTF001_025779 [Ficus carica]|uniref:Uncharacterized protein n=1 Tax=Ficus carica TaxID=3494 RepID=A0AA88APK4_FICCA|nr:hypothetical protein TIFTF001_025779 [Ficus carica]